MRVKNNWNRPIRVGRQIITKGAVEDVPEHLLLQPRIQKLREGKKLIFPYREEDELVKEVVLKAAELTKESKSKGSEKTKKSSFSPQETLDSSKPEGIVKEAKKKAD